MISKLTRVGGSLKIDIDGVCHEPLAFKTFRPTKENISDFAKAGVKFLNILTMGRLCAYKIPYSLFGESWLGIRQYDLDAIDRQIDLFIENAPDAYFALMLSVDTRPWWLETHENYPDSYGWLSQMCHDPEWREEAAHYLQTVIRHVEEKYGDKMYAYFLLCGTGTEWLSDKDYHASHPMKEEYFRRHIGDPNAVIPTEKEIKLPKNISFYEDENVKRYHRAHAEAISDAIIYFAGKAQKILNHQKLVGIYYGYVLELRDKRFWEAGHQDYERVYNHPDIDIISSPASYEHRAPDSTSSLMVAQKTLELNNKLYYMEFDQRTYLTQSELEGVTIPRCGYHCKDDLETVNMMQRDFMLCLTQGAALWWFDMWNGWYSAPKMQEGIAQMVNISKKTSALSAESASEIAIFVSGSNFYGVNEMSDLNMSLMVEQKSAWNRVGAPYDVYSLGDLGRVDLSRYKLFVFPVAFELEDWQEKEIEKIKNEGGKTLLFYYAPNYLKGGLAACERILGIALAESDRKPIMDSGVGRPLPKPYLYVEDENADVFAYFNDSRAAIASKKFEKHTVFYSAVGNLTTEAFRYIARKAGVHIYCDTAPVYVNSRLIGVYNREPCVLTVKENGAYEELFSGKIYRAKDRKLTVEGGAYFNKLFLFLPEKD